MKCSFMSFSTPGLTLGEMLALASRLGYDGIEPRVSAGHRHGLEVDAAPGVRAEARRMAAEAGVGFACIATSCRFADPAVATGHVEDARRAIDLAADLGAPCIRVFGGDFPGGTTRADAVGHVAAALSGIAAQAQQRGVAVCLETHDSWCDPADVAAVMQRVAHPSIGVNWDIMHPVRAAGKTMDEAFQALRPWVRHTHVHDCAAGERAPLVPIGDGVIDHARAVVLLHDAGYEGFLSGEWIDWEPADVHLPRELARLRRILSDAGARGSCGSLPNG